MNRVPIIRKGVFKDYWKTGALGGLLALLYFFIVLSSHSLLLSLQYALYIWIAFVLQLSVLGFLGIEYFERRIKLNKLYSPKYNFLEQQNFMLHQDLYFDGVYKDYWFRVIPMNKWRKRAGDIDFFVIETFYKLDAKADKDKMEGYLSGDYFLGKFTFSNQCLGCVLDDWQNPNFEVSFNNLIGVLKKEQLSPLSLSEWEEITGKSMKEDRVSEVASRSKHVFKFRKFCVGNIGKERCQNYFPNL